MKISERTLRISAASFLALLMVGSAYLLSGPNFLTSRAANAESTEALLKAYSTKDTDGDGLPDWEEALYGTDPNKAISNPYGIPDGQAAQEGKLTPHSLATQLPSANQGTTTLTDADFGGVPSPAPGSITDQFSKEFLQEYMATSNGQPMDQAAQDALVQKLLGDIAAQSSQAFSSSYRPVDVHTNVETSALAYTSQLETALTSNDLPSDESDPVAVIDSLVEKNDNSARPKLLAISNAYSQMAQTMRSAKVPPSLSATQVSVVTSLDQLAATTKAISDYTNDPVGTLGALTTFNKSTKLFADSLSSLASVILQSGEPQAGEPGDLIVTLARTSSHE